MTSPRQRFVKVQQSGLGPYGQVIVAGRHILSADEPESVGGQDSGPDPYELVMAGLGACTAMTLRMYADRHGWPMTGLEVHVRHVERVGADGVKADRFDRSLTFSGALSLEQRARLLEVADRCPVSQTLKRGSDVTVVEAETA